MRIRTKDSIKKVWLFFSLIFPHIKPSGIAALYPRLSILFNYGSLMSFLFIALLIIVKPKGRPRNYGFLLLVLLMEAWIMCTTLLHHSETIFSSIISFTSSVSIPMIFFYFSNNMEELLKALYIELEWLMYASVISIILYAPEGMYKAESGIAQYFLGNENGIIFYVIPAMFLAFIYMRKERKYLRGMFLIITCLVNEVIVWCATGIVGITVAVLLVLYAYKKRKKINYYVILCGALLVNVTVVQLRLFEKIDFLIYYIQQWLGKSLTFSGRTSLWILSENLIKKNLLTGLGRGDHVYIWGKYMHAHNEYYQMLLVGGMPLLILFITLLVYIGRKFKKRDTYTELMVMAMMVCMFVQFIATSRITYRLYIPLMLAAYVREIEDIVNIGCRKRRKANRLSRIS